MKPYWSSDEGDVVLHLGDCLDVLRLLPECSVDAIVTDPPYGLEFMGREWDGADGFRRSLNAADAGRDSVFGRTSRTSPEYKTGKPSEARIRERVDGRTNPAEGKSVTRTPEAYVAGSLFQEWCQAWATECLRVLKPGGHMLAFGGTRTYHRLTCGIEDAGFEIRDSLHWIYAQGFPKSVNMGKDSRFCQCEVGQWSYGHSDLRGVQEVVSDLPKDSAASEVPDMLQAWRGWPLCGRCGKPAVPRGLGTALKPAWEPVVVARKPLAGTVAANVLEYGTGALNIDGCRVATADALVRPPVQRAGQQRRRGAEGAAGRWPANVVFTHSASCEMTGTRRVKGITGGTGHHGNSVYGKLSYDEGVPVKDYADADGMETVEAWSCAAGCPVAELDRQSGVTSETARTLNRNGSRQMEGWGLGAVSQDTVHGDTGGASRFFPVFRYQAKAPASERPRLKDGTAHPTVKPLSLMNFLVRLVTPPGGTVLDPFGGSGTSAEACIVEGFRCVLIEQDPASAELIRTRLSKPIQPVMFG